MTNKKNMRIPKMMFAAPVSLATRVYEDTHNQYYRNKYMRDRDRVLYSKAFRRLAGKTQVYLAHYDEHMRTRLTHTLEVAQIAKTISTALRLDIDLTEAIALGHDIGHTPFGHAGEYILHQLMTPKLLDSSGNIVGKYTIKESPMSTLNDIDLLRKHSGFKHNHQSIRIATELENTYEDNGLNLTNFTLYGILNHSNLEYKDYIPRHDFLEFYENQKRLLYMSNDQRAWSFEAFVVAEADEIAQRHHDLEDAMRGNLITSNDIKDLIHDNFSSFMTLSDKNNFRELKSADPSYFTPILSRTIVNLLVTRIIRSSLFNLNKLCEKHHLSQNIFKDFMLTADEEEMKKAIMYDYYGEDLFCKKLDNFAKSINTRTISSYDVQKMDAKGEYIIRKIFEAFYNNPQQLTDQSVVSYFRYDNSLGNRKEVYQTQCNSGIGYIRHKFCEIQNGTSVGSKLMLMRVICDHISGMTDLYAIDTYERLYGIKHF